MRTCARRLLLAGLALLSAGASAAGEAASPEPKMAAMAPRLAMSGAMRLPSGAEAYQRGPAVAFGDGTFLVVWQEGYHGLGGHSDILALRFDEKGRALDEKPIAVCVDDAVQDSPAVAFCAGKFLVAWADFRNGRDYDIYATLVSSKGEVAAKNGALVAGGKGGQACPAVAGNGKDAFQLVWQDYGGGKCFEVRGARISADKGELLDKEPSLLLTPGEWPAIAWNGTNYLLATGQYNIRRGQFGTMVGADGKPAGGQITLWSSNALAPTAVTAWGKSLAFYNTSPLPDPWGWSHNGAVVGVSATPNGASPEYAWAKHGWYELGNDLANRVVKNAVEAARWRNHNSWPMGMPGGFKGSHDGAWPSGKIAAAWNGRSLLVVWTEGNFLDELRLANRDLSLKRVLEGWACVDEPKIKLVAGPTDEANPALAAGPSGNALLAYERQLPEGGVAIECRLLAEEEDRQAPRVAWVAQESPKTIRLGFDEPVEAASAGQAANYSIEGLAVRSAAFVSETPALQREVVLETDEQTAGKTYALKIKGVKDLSPAANATAGEVFEFESKPGKSQRSDFIERWLVVGRFPDNWDEAWLDAKAVHPTPGDAVKARTAEELKAALKKVVPAEAWDKDDWDANCDKLFSGDKSWKVASTVFAGVLRISQFYDKAPMSSVYANTYAYSDREREGFLRIDSNDGNRAWLNGEEIGFHPAKPTRGFHDSTDELPAKLKKGWNQLLIQVENKFGEWMMIAQFTDKNKQPIRGLTYQLENPFEPK